ncbi:hypothetical protein D1646_15740 [Pseudoflavonifractor sp. 60]|uniref:hypothetical protein n=1 Tax=Pseudoflavonifractor sp. 60 TaxID=2304576 RepID=UPI00136A09B3|nr:hypothetical protein [Pseudoflavonifractor sp. 60]NBI68227.1 hypothetical protein [Pseudoflavonifractor sp. 60]
MKHRIISFALAGVMCLSMAACKGEEKSSPSNSIPSDSSASSSQAQSSSIAPESKGGETPFERFAAELDDANYSYESVVMAAELVGAKIGMKYKFDFGKVELYQFEDGSEALSKAINDNGLTMEGFGVFPCQFNGNLALLIDVTENEDNLLSIFTGL